jgi:transcriptional regulator with XRE-family HTH domain
MTQLQEWRKRRGVSQDDMAAVTGISRSTYSKLERGLIDNPPLRYLSNCALALGCNLRELIEEDWLDWMVFDERKAQPPEAEQFWRAPSG